MSVQTTADRLRDELIELNQKSLLIARRLLEEEDIWGRDDFRNGFWDDIYDSLREVRKVLAK